MLKPLAVQLYSLRDEASKDFKKVLKKVAEIGYKGVEPAGFWNIRPSEFRKVLADYGLELYASHSPWAAWRNAGECMDIADAAGLKNIVCGYGAADFADLDAIKRTAETVNQLEEFFRRNGFTLFQHNHAFEFERLDGRLKYEIYAELCPNVKFELDAYWSANFGNEDPVENMKKFASRTILLHVKDGILHQQAKEQKMVNGLLDRKIDLVPLGTGELDIPNVIKNAPDHLQAVIVELDYCNIDMIEAIEKSYHYMTSNHLAEGNR